MNEFRWDLIRPCENCPFANAPNRIKFAAESRAREIEEHAYRNGFPCHEHADWVEEEDDPLGGGGAYPRQDGSSQHCFGAIAMYLQGGMGGNIPWENAVEDDEDLEGYWWDRAELDALSLVFQNEEEFFAANKGDDHE